MNQAQPVAAPSTSPILVHVANDNYTDTKLQLQSSYTALIAGVQANYAPNAMFPLVQGDFTRDQLVAQFQQYAQAAQATSTAYRAWRSAVQCRTNARSRRASARSVRAFATSWWRSWARALGSSPATASHHGRWRRPRPSTKAASQVKAEATRKARGTVGKKQKLAISGNMTGVTITPITSASSTEPAAASAAVAPPTAPATTATPVATKS